MEDIEKNSSVAKSPEQEPVQRKKSWFLSELFTFVLVTVFIVLPIRMFIAQPFIVEGASMDPTFASGQYLIIDEISYRFNEPERGDVIVLRFPHERRRFLIKRIVGLPGETVELRGQEVFITNTTHPEGFSLDEPYLQLANTRRDFSTIILTDDEYFVMGDNRGVSSDSRDWGTLPQNNIVGRAFARLYPLTTLSLFPGSLEDFQ